MPTAKISDKIWLLSCAWPVSWCPVMGTPLNNPLYPKVAWLTWSRPGTNSVTSSVESSIIIYILLDSPAFRWPCHLLLADLGWTCGWPKLTCRELFCHSCWFRARLFLSPLADSCCVVYQLCGTVSFPSLQRLQQIWLPHLHLLPPSFHPSESVHRAAGCVVWGIHFVRANCNPSYNFCTTFAGMWII